MQEESAFQHPDETQTPFFRQQKKTNLKDDLTINGDKLTHNTTMKQDVVESGTTPLVLMAPKFIHRASFDSTKNNQHSV